MKRRAVAILLLCGYFPPHLSLFAPLENGSDRSDMDFADGVAAAQGDGKKEDVLLDIGR